ncbi:MAG: FAD-dependent oxidoreductase [Planctomycetota bacterium]
MTAVNADCDILILGAGPAGAAAALFAAAKGLNVAVLDRGAKHKAGQTFEWVHPDARALLDKVGGSIDPVAVGKIDRIRFLDTRGEKEAGVSIDRPVDIVDTWQLTRNLLSAAKKAGLRIINDVEVTAIDVHEQGVHLADGDGNLHAGRILLAADGCDSLVAKSLGVERGAEYRTGGRNRDVIMEAVTSLPSSAIPDGPAELTLSLSSEDFGTFGYAFVAGKRQVAGLIARASDDDSQAEYERFIANNPASGVVATALASGSARTSVRPLPRGVALDTETHVAKHCLSIGDAGGYVCALSQEGLYPSLWSAKLAVDVCETALQNAHPQDALIEFDARWRQEMVDYLRLPNADLRFLLPLIFTNDRMAKKLAHSFLLGENI